MKGLPKAKCFAVPVSHSCSAQRGTYRPPERIASEDSKEGRPGLAVCLKKCNLPQVQTVLLLSGMTHSRKTETFLFDLWEDEPHREEDFPSKECVGLHQHLELLFLSSSWRELFHQQNTQLGNRQLLLVFYCTCGNIHGPPVLLSFSNEDKVSIDPYWFCNGIS